MILKSFEILPNN